MANPALQTTRAIQDSSLQVTSAQPDNNATVRGNAIDLGAITPYPATERLVAQIVTTVSTGANNKNINIRLQHANVNANVNFVNIPELAIVTVPELSATYAATTANFALPPATRQFIRTIAVVENTGGNATDGNCTLKILL